MEAHERGECRPCAYFWQKQDGCRLGDSCVFCHKCDSDALKRMKRQKRQRMRLLRRGKGEEDDAAGSVHGEAGDNLDLVMEPLKVMPVQSFLGIGPPPGLPSRGYMPAHVYLKDYPADLLPGKLIEVENISEFQLQRRPPSEPYHPVSSSALLGNALVDALQESPPASPSGPQAQSLQFSDMFPELGAMLHGPRAAPGHRGPRGEALAVPGMQGGQGGQGSQGSLWSM